jgi:hypothetical protein
MNYTYHGTQDLITLPERSVQTFPSGLVRVDRVYACRKNQVARFRDQLRAGNPLPFDSGAPAIDGLFIFPEPRETIRDDGFAEFRVSAYGRANTTGTITKQGAIQPFDDFNFLYENYIFTKVLPSNVSLSQIFESPQIEAVSELQTSPRVLSVTEYRGPITLKPPGTIGLTFFIPPEQRAFVFKIQSPDGSFEAYILYLLNDGIKYESHTTQNFGTFSEYTIVYSPNILEGGFPSLQNFLPV